ncbi:MAG: hypothetical protein HY098_08305 [Nitrospinae bacterium]|nr:hypothetical protein [Nitrospinota bacterium]
MSQPIADEARTITISGGRVYDPAHGLNGPRHDVIVEGGRIVAGISSTLRTLSAHGCVVMPGGIDVHSHPLGASRLARLVGAKELAGYADFAGIAAKYNSIGYTFFVEAGLDAVEAGAAAEECGGENVGCAVLPFGARGGDQPGKFVGEKGVEDFFNAPETRAVHHVHLPELARIGGLETLERFLVRLSGRRCHLSHVSHYAFESRGGKIAPAGAKAAGLLSRHPNVTFDCGPVVFGPALAFTADNELAVRVSKAGGGGLFSHEKSRFSAVPYVFREANETDSLLWINGMELLLATQHLKSASLSIDFPSGGALEGIPRIIALLMDREKRGAFLDGLNADAVEASSLKGMRREFSLYEVATVTRWAPGLVAGTGADDAVVYKEGADMEKMFANPLYVVRGKRRAVKEG